MKLFVALVLFSVAVYSVQGYSYRDREGAARPVPKSVPAPSGCYEYSSDVVSYLKDMSNCSEQELSPDKRYVGYQCSFGEGRKVGPLWVPISQRAEIAITKSAEARTIKIKDSIATFYRSRKVCNGDQQPDRDSINIKIKDAAAEK